MKTRMSFLSLMVVLAAGAVAVEPADKPAVKPDEVVARVGDSKIKRHELDLAAQGLQMQLAQQGRSVPTNETARFERYVLDQMVDRELLLQEARTQQVPDLEAKVKEQMERLTTQVGGKEALAKMFAETGVTEAEYTKRLRDEVLIQEALQRFIQDKAQVTGEETKEFYDANTARFKQPEQVRASHILIRVPPQASAEVQQAKRAQIDAARALITGGEKFGDVAGKVSEDPGSARNGGDLGFFARGQMVPEFELAAFSLKTNEVSEVVTTQFGYHILLVTARKPAEQQPYDSVKDDIAKFLRYRKGGELARTHVQELRAKAKIEVLLPPLPEAPKP